jgi:hypothetical protein
MNFPYPLSLPTFVFHSGKGEGVPLVRRSHGCAPCFCPSCSCVESMVSSLPDEATRAALLGMENIESQVAVFLMRQFALGPASRWAPYMAVMPKFVNVAPLWPRAAVDSLQVCGMRGKVASEVDLRSTWMEDVSSPGLALLLPSTSSSFLHQDPSTIEEILSIRETHEKEYRDLEATIALLVGSVQNADAHTTFLTGNAESATSLSNFLYATSLATSRALTLKGRKYLVPFADMFNFAPHFDKREDTGGDHFLRFHQVTDTVSAEAGAGSNWGMKEEGPSSPFTSYPSYPFSTSL